MATRRAMNYGDFTGPTAPAPGPRVPPAPLLAYPPELAAGLEAALVRWRSTRLSRSSPTHTAWLRRDGTAARCAELLEAVPVGLKAWLLGSLDAFLDALQSHGVRLVAPQGPVGLADLSAAEAPFDAKYLKRTTSATPEILRRLADVARDYGCTRARLTSLGIDYAYAIHTRAPLPPELELHSGAGTSTPVR